MARINLLPWRETLKKERERRFYIFVGLTIFAAIGAVAGIHLEMENRIQSQKDRNQFLNQQITFVDKEIAAIKSLEVEKTRLLNRMDVIQRLQKSRPEIVHLFEAMVTTTPDGVQILKISQKLDNINIEGVAESNSRISSFMRNLEKSKWLKQPELIVIDADTRDHPNSSWFSLKVKRSQAQ